MWMQDDQLSGEVSSVDIATKKNLDDLVEVGDELLKKSVSWVNLDTGLNDCTSGQETNEEALIRYRSFLLYFFSGNTR